MVEALAGGWGQHPATGDLLRERATTDTNGPVRRAAVQALASGHHARIKRRDVRIVSPLI